MRANGVRSLVYYSACPRTVVFNVDAYPEAVPVPAFGPHMVSTGGGMIGADARPNCRKGPQWALREPFTSLSPAGRWYNCEPIIGKHEEEVMKTQYTVALTLLAGVAIGAIAVQSLHAQSKPMAYVIAENIVTNEDAYSKEFSPLIAKAIQEHGGKFLARGGKTTPMHGKAPAPRVVIVQFESMDKAQEWLNAPATKSAFAIGEKHATLNDYIVEGVSQ